MSDNANHAERYVIDLQGQMEIAESHLAGYGVALMLPGARISWTGSNRQRIEVPADADAAARTVSDRVRAIADEHGWLAGNHLCFDKNGNVEVYGVAGVGPWISPFQSDSTDFYEDWNDVVRWAERNARSRTTMEELLEKHRDGQQRYNAGEIEKPPKDPRAGGRIAHAVKERNWELVYQRRRDVLDSAEVRGDPLVSAVIESLGKPAYWPIKTDSGTADEKKSGSSDTKGKAGLGGTPLMAYCYNSGRDFLAQNVVEGVLRCGVRGTGQPASISDAEIMARLRDGITEDTFDEGSMKSDWNFALTSGVRTVVAFYGLAVLPSVHRMRVPTTTFGALTACPGGALSKSRQIAGLRLPMFEAAVSPWRVTTVVSDRRWYELEKPEARQWAAQQGVSAVAEFPSAEISKPNNTSSRLSKGRVREMSDYAETRTL